MKLTKHLPATPAALTTFRDDFDRMMDRLFYPGGFPLPTHLTEAVWNPSLDFSETDKQYVVRVEAPGVAKEDLEVKLDGQLLTIRGKRVAAKEEKDEQFVWREREEGSFVRSLRLPLPVDEAKVEAKVENGVMTVMLPKKDVALSTKIPIK